MGHPDDAAHGPLPRGYAHGAPAALRHPRRQAGRAEGIRFDASFLSAWSNWNVAFLVGFPSVVVLSLSLVCGNSGGSFRATRRSSVGSALSNHCLSKQKKLQKDTEGYIHPFLASQEIAVEAQYRPVSLLGGAEGHSRGEQTVTARGETEHVEWAADIAVQHTPSVVQFSIGVFSPTNPVRAQSTRLTHCICCRRSAPKVFVEAALRDPASGNKLLAEGEGLFYIRKPPTSPPAKTARGAPSANAQQDNAKGVRRAPSAAYTGRSSLPPVATAEVPLKAPPGADACGARGGGSRQPRFSQPPPPPPQPSEATSTTASAGTRGSPELLSYDEAIQKFGPGNPDAAANVVEFYGGDVNSLRQRAKL